MRYAPELITVCQPPLPKVKTPSVNPQTAIAPVTPIIQVRRHAMASAAMPRTSASTANASRSPACGNNTNPVSNVPITAPRVFQVSSDPTLAPNGVSAVDTARIIRGKTAPINAAGNPRMTSAAPPLSSS